jgi:mannose-6-phosphate isomerase-like protein (cupin superfamily)
MARRSSGPERFRKIMDVVQREAAPPFVTKDGSTIREILSPRNAPGSIRGQSLAEATVPAGSATQAHYHPVTEEIYYILRGRGEMRLGEETRTVGPGDGIAIPPGQAHRIANPGPDDLVFLCACVPAYTHEDTVLVDL